MRVIHAESTINSYKSLILKPYRTARPWKFIVPGSWPPLLCPAPLAIHRRKTVLEEARLQHRAGRPSAVGLVSDVPRPEEPLPSDASAKERFEREQVDHGAKLAARNAKAAASGKKPRGKPLQPPVERPLPTDQVNLTDEESRIMPVAGGGGGGWPAGGRHRCGAGHERQAADRADAEQDRRLA